MSPPLAMTEMPQTVDLLIRLRPQYCDRQIHSTWEQCGDEHARQYLYRVGGSLTGDDGGLRNRGGRSTRRSYRADHQQPTSAAGQPLLAAAALPSPAPNALLGAQFGASAEAAAPSVNTVGHSGALITFLPTAGASGTSARSAAADSGPEFTPGLVTDVVSRAGGGEPNTAVTVLVASPDGPLQVVTTTIADLPGALAGLLGDIGGQIPFVNIFVRNGTLDQMTVVC